MHRTLDPASHAPTVVRPMNTRTGLTARPLTVAWLVGSWLLAAVFGRAGEAKPSDLELKVAFLYNFAKFTVWPSEALAPTGQPFTIGILDGASGEHRLDGLVKGRTVHGRPIRIVRLSAEDDIRGCQLVFIAGQTKQALARLLDAARGTSLLTVGEAEDFLDRGGMIRLSLVGERLHFEIDLEHAALSRLEFSSSLLALALDVRGLKD